MAARQYWGTLPGQLRAAVEHHVGPVVDCHDLAEGQNNDLAVIVRCRDGQSVFLKGVHGVSRRMRWLRNEIDAGPMAPGIAPRVLFHADIGDWLIVGFEPVAGRPAGLGPGSADLGLVASVVGRIGALPGTGLPMLRQRWSGEDWWAVIAARDPGAAEQWHAAELAPWSVRAPDVVAGDRLLHTDLHADQFLITADDTVRVIDWGRPGAGAGWVDVAFLVIRLMLAGHPAEDAEAWATTVDAWARASDDAVTSFAAYVAGLWSHWALTDAEPGAVRRAGVARAYANWRVRPR